ncbi:MAG: peptide ABC transporter substrate-binding protein [Actinomycetota bacterium]
MSEFKRSRSLKLFALLLAMSLIAAACGGDDGDAETTTAEGEPVVGGTLVVGAEQEPSESLNVELAAGNLAWAQWIINSTTLRGAFVQLPDFTYGPDMITEEPVPEEDPFAITYTIKEEAQWSDETPISAEDFEFTWQVYIDEKNKVASRAGYDVIEDAEIIDEKTIKFTFSEPYAGWRDLFRTVFPKHALEGENFNRVWTNEIVNPQTGEPIASGPFIFESYEKGSELTVVRNENYWGEHTAYLDSIVFRFIPETASEIQALRGGEVDAIYPQPQLELAELTAEPNIEIETNPGTTWEHMDFQYANELLAQDFVRQAIAFGVNRQAIVDQLFQSITPDLPLLQNMIFLNPSPFYEEHFNIYEHDPEQAISLLEENGCTRDGPQDIFECDGQELSFGFKSTAGNALRELVFEIVQEQLRLVGIDVKSEFGDAAVVFGDQGLVGGKYDIFMFAWVGSPDPGGSVEIHKCEGSQNYQAYCNEEVTDLLEESDVTVDPQARADLMNQADELMAQDLPILPLYVKPTFFAFHSKLQNAIDNPTQAGFAWNAVEWFIEE